MNSLTNFRSASGTKSPADMRRVMFELDQFKRKAERLDLINKLHGRLASALSVGSMIEAYSVWLMPIAAYDLIGYRDPARDRTHLFCSEHGPDRRRAMAIAEELFAGAAPGSGVLDGARWLFESVEGADILLIFKQAAPLSSHEMQVVRDSLAVFAESLQRATEYEELFEQASTDPLTGLLNRRAFDERIIAMMNGAQRYKSPLTMLSLDLDRFKQINDNLGHKAGDEVLKQVAGLLGTAIRATDLLVRIGGDEFLIVLDNTDLDQAMNLAERLVTAIDALDVWADDIVKLGASIGLAQLGEGESLGDWLNRTDDCLYHAKIGGRSRVAIS